MCFGIFICVCKLCICDILFLDDIIKLTHKISLRSSIQIGVEINEHLYKLNISETPGKIETNPNTFQVHIT